MPPPDNIKWGFAPGFIGQSEKQKMGNAPSPPGDGGGLLHASPGSSGCTPAEPYPPGREEAFPVCVRMQQY